MSGRVYQQSNGDYYVDYKRGDKRVYRKVPSKLAGTTIIKKLDAEFGLHVSQKHTFKAYAKDYLKTAKVRCKPSTYSDYKGILNTHLLPEFGNKPVVNISKKEIRLFLQKKLELLSVSTVKHLKAVLSNVFGLAIEDEIINDNPALGLSKIFPKKKKSSNKFLTKEEVTKILETAKTEKPEHFLLFLLLARTGLRLGEALALKWKDIDLTKRSICVQRSIVRGIIGSPKSHEMRIVDMSAQLASELAKAEKKSNWLFPGKKNKPLNGDTWRKKVFKPIIVKSGLPESIKIHGLRHAFASFLIQNNENLKYVSDQLGHHSIQITADIYGHLVPRSDKSAVDRLDD
ncbi:integrase family protein [Candidatus Magnetomorum sp. HK-1]|nr:integrase family protein [Candidatus Magnetomorum sp. HK-1]